MPRTRRYQPIPDDVCKYRELSWCSSDAQVLYFRLLAKVDDDGRYEGDPSLLLADLFPFSRHITERQVLKWIMELSDQRVLIRYKVDGEYFVKLTHYVSSAKSKPRVRFPDPPANWRQWAAEAPKGEPVWLFNVPECTEMGLNGTNGSAWYSFVSLPEPDTVHPLPLPLPPPEPVPVPEPMRPLPGNGDSAPVKHDANANRVASDSASGSDFVGGEGEKAGSSDLSTSRRTFKDAIAKLAGGHNEQAANLFVESALSVLKPGNGNDKDRADLSVLFYRLAGKCPDVRALRDALVWCFEAAIEKRVGKAGYGAWRKSVAARFGNWSVKGVVL